MPDRIVRVGILTSDAVNSLSWAAETFYRRLMSVVDDYGRFDGRPAVLRATLYPLKLDRVSERDVETWLRNCEETGLVTCYTADGKPYVEIQKFDQRLRAKNSKWPPPPSSADICQQVTTNATESETNTEEKESPPKKFSDEDLATARHIFALIKKLDSKRREPDFEKWANEIRLMREVDGREMSEIRAVFEWANTDNFWKTNILSAGKLREKFSTLLIQKNNPKNGKVNGAKPSFKGAL